jgi:hypothetical protein
VRVDVAALAGERARHRVQAGDLHNPELIAPAGPGYERCVSKTQSPTVP